MSEEVGNNLINLAVQLTKSSNRLPKGLDYEYQNSFYEYKELNERATQKSRKLLTSLLSFLSSSPLKVNQYTSGFTDALIYDQVAQTIDNLLDKTTSFDQPNFMGGEETFMSKKELVVYNLIEMEKPQSYFKDIDNSRESYFRPKLRNKYHSKGGESFTNLETNYDSPPHPYEKELNELAYPSWMLNKSDSSHSIAFPDPNRSTSMISTSEELEAMIEELNNEKLVAVDLEHHSHRSFLGFTCLIQISTPSKDFIIDPLCLREECEKLGKVFANPNILKVLHGCDHDVLWMQRDFGLYLVNAFDTHLAAKELQLPSLSLGSLVKYYCNVELNKKYQLSDWRQRPLPDEMMEYAKLDTHYLPFIFGCLVHDLWERGGLQSIERVLFQTRRLCLQRYEKPSFDPTGYKKLFLSFNESLNPVQEAAFSALWNWRDERARKEDESCEYIMSETELLRLGRKVPTTLDSLESCGPFSHYIQKNKVSILQLLSNLSSLNPTVYSVDSDALVARNTSFEASRMKQEELTIFRAIPKVASVLEEASGCFKATSSNSTLPESKYSIEEIFKEAGWTHRRGIFSQFLPLHLQQRQVSDEGVQSQAMTDLKSFITDDLKFESVLRQAVKQSSEIFSEPALDSRPPAEVQEVDEAQIPLSYEEIYRLSGKNRRKNKEKKRGRETDSSIETDVMEIESSVEVSGPGKLPPLPEIDSYFSGIPKMTNVSVEETLHFARGIGWLESDRDVSDALEDHHKVLSEVQSGEDEDRKSTEQVPSQRLPKNPSSGAGSKLIRQDMFRGSSNPLSVIPAKTTSASSNKASGSSSKTSGTRGKAAASQVSGKGKQNPYFTQNRSSNN